MRSIRRSHANISEVDAGLQESGAFADEDRAVGDDNCSGRGNELSLWFADLLLALGCFAVITAAGQLPLTGPRLLEAISSARIATTAKRLAAQRETRENKSGSKTPEEGSLSKLHLPTVVTLN